MLQALLLESRVLRSPPQRLAGAPNVVILPLPAVSLADSTGVSLWSPGVSSFFLSTSPETFRGRQWAGLDREDSSFSLFLDCPNVYDTQGNWPEIKIWNLRILGWMVLPTFILVGWRETEVSGNEALC